MRFRHTLIAALVLLGIGWTGAALAATYYVSPMGSAANAGTQLAPWSLGKANSTLVGGDVAILLSGNYGTGTISPANSGTSNATMIAYVGSLSNPGSTVVAGVNYNGYVSVKGFKINSTVQFDSPNDSLAWCVVPTGTMGAALGGDNSVAAHCQFTGGAVGINGGPNGPTASLLSRVTVYDCTFNLTLNGFGPALSISTTDQLNIVRCRFFITIGPNGDHGTFKMYGGRRGRFVDCMFDYQNQRPVITCDECGTSYYRDYSMFNVFLRDTFVMHGPEKLDMMVSASGSYTGTTQGNKWDSCVFRQDAPGVSAVVYWQNGARADTMVNCTIVSKGLLPIRMSNFGSGCLIKNNSFIQIGAGNAADATAWGDRNWVYNNIFYALPSGATGIGGAALTTDGSGASGAWTGNNNLYYCSNPAASAIYISGVGSSPGASGKFCTSYGSECASKYGSPLFVGGSSVMSFDPRLTQNSAAIGAGVGGVDAGAIPFASAGTDTIPPSTITDLAASLVTDQLVQLSWTAPGDDGTVGRASSYDVRMSTTPITPINFAGATAVSNSLVPQTSGLRESLNVGGLGPGVTYYFAIRAIDESANTSAMSNLLTSTTAATDTIPPARVQDLSAGP